MSDARRSYTPAEAALASRDRVSVDPARLVVPLAGTIRWKHRPGREPVAMGVWARDFPCAPHVPLDKGGVRPLTRAERRWCERIARRYRRTRA